MDKFLSASLPVAERKGAYETALRTYFGDDYVDKHIQVDLARPESFAASMEPIELGHVHGAIHMSNAPHSVSLAPSDTNSRDLVFYLLLNGDMGFEGSDGSVHLRSGDMALVRCAGPVSSFSAQMDMIALCLPERLIGHRVDRSIAINRTVSGRTGLGACLGALLRAAAQRRSELSLEEELVLQSSVVDAVLQAASMDDPSGDPMTGQQEAKLRRLKRNALSQLHNPELTPKGLADDLGVSVRTVHRLFHCSGATFRDWLREERLQRCWEALTEPSSSRRSVAEVAFQWGFNDLTTFNRSFRGKYGVCPTAARGQIRPTPETANVYSR